MVFERKDHKTAQNTREVQVCMNRKLCSPKGFGNLGLVTKLDLESTDQISLGIGHVLFHSGVCTIASDHFNIYSPISYYIAQVNSSISTSFSWILCCRIIAWKKDGFTLTN